MEYKDYYQILGVDRNASLKDIKSAYRRLTKKYHPDLNHGDKEAEIKYRSVNEAYEVLGDPDKRAKYDQFGEQWKYVKDGKTPPRGGTGGYDFSDIFSQFTGGGGASRFGSQSGRSSFFDMLFGNMGGGGGNDGGFSFNFGNMGGRQGFGGASYGRGGGMPKSEPKKSEAEITISLAEAYGGCKKEIKISKPESCPACGGSGYLSGGICGACGGHGQRRENKTVEVSIPAGVAKLRILDGTVILKIGIAADPVYKIKGRDLHCELWVPFKEAMLGGSASLKLPNGKTVDINIKPGTQNGKVFRLPGLGLPNPKGGGGSLFARLMVKLPEELTAEQKEALQSF